MTVLTNQKSKTSRSAEIGYMVVEVDLPEAQEVQPRKGASAWPWLRVM